MTAAIYGAHTLLLSHGVQRIPRHSPAGRWRESLIPPPAEIQEVHLGGWFT